MITFSIFVIKKSKHLNAWDSIYHLPNCKRERIDTTKYYNHSYHHTNVVVPIMTAIEIRNRLWVYKFHTLAPEGTSPLRYNKPTVNRSKQNPTSTIMIPRYRPWSALGCVCFPEKYHNAAPIPTANNTTKLTIHICVGSVLVLCISNPIILFTIKPKIIEAKYAITPIQIALVRFIKKR